MDHKKHLVSMTSDVVIINCEKTKKSHRGIHKHKCSGKKTSCHKVHHRHFVHQDYRSSCGVDRHSEKPQINCVINLKTTVCQHNECKMCHRKHSRCFKQSTHKPSSNCESRILPICFRTSCCSRQSRYFQKCGHSYKNKIDRGSRQQNRKRTLFSPVSPSPLLDLFSPISYENLSPDYPDPPLSYKTVQIDEKFPPSKLDTLIKRTKEREKKMQEEVVFHLRQKPLATSTLIDQTLDAISSDEFPSFDDSMDLSAPSMHSLSTVVLESKVKDSVYSPRYPMYSPTESYVENNIRIKEEPKDSWSESTEKISYSSYNDSYNTNDVDITSTYVDGTAVCIKSEMEFKTSPQCQYGDTVSSQQENNNNCVLHTKFKCEDVKLEPPESMAYSRNSPY